MLRRVRRWGRDGNECVWQAIPLSGGRRVKRWQDELKGANDKQELSVMTYIFENAIMEPIISYANFKVEFKGFSGIPSQQNACWVSVETWVWFLGPAFKKSGVVACSWQPGAAETGTGRWQGRPASQFSLIGELQTTEELFQRLRTAPGELGMIHTRLTCVHTHWDIIPLLQIRN